MGKNCLLIIKFLLFCEKKLINYIYELKSKNLKIAKLLIVISSFVIIFWLFFA